jgi:hypothetical protein
LGWLLLGILVAYVARSKQLTSKCDYDTLVLRGSGIICVRCAVALTQQVVLLDKQLRQLRQQHQEEAAALTAELNKARYAARWAANRVNMPSGIGSLALQRAQSLVGEQEPWGNSVLGLLSSRLTTKRQSCVWVCSRSCSMAQKPKGPTRTNPKSEVCVLADN